AFINIKNCLELQIPVVCGTTGWLARKAEVESIAETNTTAFLYGSNFSLGVNLFFALNEKLAKLMRPFDEYKVQLEEIHHSQMIDAPSGPAISLAQGIMGHDGRYNAWKLQETKGAELRIFASREDEVPGTHKVSYRS